MIKDYHYSLGPRHTGPQYTLRTGVPTQLLGGRHPRRSSQALVHMCVTFAYLGVSAIVTFAYLGVSAIITFMLTLGRSWTLLERRGYLLVTTRLRKHIEYIFLLARGSFLSRDVQFDEDSALQRFMNLPAQEQPT